MKGHAPVACVGGYSQLEAHHCVTTDSEGDSEVIFTLTTMYVSLNWMNDSSVHHATVSLTPLHRSPVTVSYHLMVLCFPHIPSHVIVTYHMCKQKKLLLRKETVCSPLGCPIFEVGCGFLFHKFSTPFGAGVCEINPHNFLDAVKDYIEGV